MRNSGTIREDPPPSPPLLQSVLISDDSAERARFRVYLRQLERCSFEAIPYESFHGSAEIAEAHLAIIPDRLISPLLRFVPELFTQLPTLCFGSAAQLAAAYLAGAGDFMKDPWDARELLFRIDRLLPPPHGKEEARQYAVEIDGHTLPVSPEEYRMLKLFCSAEDGVVTRRSLAFVLGTRTDPESRAVDMRIARLRRRMRALAGDPHPIVAVRGRGYRLSRSLHLACG